MPTQDPQKKFYAVLCAQVSDEQGRGGAGVGARALPGPAYPRSRELETVGDGGGWQAHTHWADRAQNAACRWIQIHVLRFRSDGVVAYDHEAQGDAAADGLDRRRGDASVHAAFALHAPRHHMSEHCRPCQRPYRRSPGSPPAPSASSSASESRMYMSAQLHRVLTWRRCLFTHQCTGVKSMPRGAMHGASQPPASRGASPPVAWRPALRSV